MCVRWTLTDNARAAIEAARLIGLSNAGVDLITTDISTPWYQNDGVINEVNFAPALGLADISRSHLPEFLRRHVQADGRIPIHIFVGREQAARQADERHRTLCARGTCAGLTRSGLTRIGLQALPMRPEMSLFERIHACLIRTDIEDLTIVVDDPSILESGLPVDRLDTVQIDLDETLSADTQWQALTRMLRQLGPSVRTGARH
jgi:cyanophycin synthetase